MAHTLPSRLGRLGLVFVVALALLAACLGLASFADQPARAPDLRGFRNLAGLRGLQSVPAVDFVAGTLSPVKATHGVPVTFAVNVVNTGELSVTLDAAASLEFSDAAGGWFTATLAAATDIPTSTAPNYMQIPLLFVPAAFPAGFVAGSYHPTLYLSGTDGDGQPYAATVTSSGNSVQVVDYVTPTLLIAVVAGSLAPTDTIQSEPISFRLGLVNPNAMDITLGPGTTLAFTDSAGLVYVATLLDAPVLPTGVTTTVEFRLTRVATATVPGVHTPTLALVGTDLGGFPIYQFTDLPDTVHVWENMAGLVEAPGTLRPRKPDYYSGIMYWIHVTNTLPCSVTIETSSQVNLNTTDKRVYEALLAAPVVIEAGEEARVTFALKGFWISESERIPAGYYTPTFRLFGTVQCQAGAFAALLISSEPTYVAPDRHECTNFGAGVTPASVSQWWTQFGGAVQVSFASPVSCTSRDWEYLYDLKLANECKIAGGCPFLYLPSGTFWADTQYMYIPSSGQYIMHTFVEPTAELTRSTLFVLAVKSCTVSSSYGSGIGVDFCATSSLSNYFVDRTARLTVAAFEPEDVFVAAGGSTPVALLLQNPETGGNASDLTLLQTDTTELRLTQNGTDVDGLFSIERSAPPTPITPQTIAALVYSVTANAGSPHGRIDLDAQVTSQGQYTYYRYSTLDDCSAVGNQPCAATPYNGPKYVWITDTITASEHISTPFIYVVDALPLSLAADSLTPAAVAWDATGLTLTARVSNTSDLAFSLAPSSTLSIPFAPRAGLAVAAAGDAAYTGVGMWSEPLSLPPHSALTLTFANTDTLAGKADGIYTPTLLLRGVFSDTVGTYDFHQHLDPAGNTVWVDGTPPTASVDELAVVQHTTSFTVTWTGSDAGSGVASFDVQARSDGGDWADWQVGVSATAASFIGADGHSYAFRARATDHAGNVGEWSAERSTAVNLLAPAVDFVAGTLAPVKVTQAVPISFTVNVVNAGELSVTLDTATALAFSDAAGGWFTATLAAASDVPTSTAPGYVQIPLVFAPAAFPAGFLAGSYHPTLHLSGTDGDGQPYAAAVTSSGNSVQVIDYVTPTLPIAVAAGSLDPADVIQSEPVSFRLALVNPNLMDITLGPGTTLAFTDSSGLVYAAPLLDAPILPTGVTSTVEFRLTRVATATAPGVYTPAVALVGTDLGGFPIYQFTDLPDTVHVWENMAGLVEVPGSLMPTEPERTSLIIFWADFTNTLPCSLMLDQRSRVVLNSEERIVYSLGLMSPITLSTGSRARLYFGSGGLTGVPDGIYLPVFNLFASDNCSGAGFSASMSSTGTTAILPSTATGIGVGISPAGGGIERTQFGGAVQLSIYNFADGRQRLYLIYAMNSCNVEGCEAHWNGLPTGTFRVHPSYLYIAGRKVSLTSLFITPSEVITRGLKYNLLAHAVPTAAGGGGVGFTIIAQGGYDVYIYDRAGKATIRDIRAFDTFAMRGAASIVMVEATNPETGPTSSALTLIPDDATKLMFRNADDDVSGYYSTSVTPPDSDIVQGTTNIVQFTTMLGLEAPLGDTLMNAELTTRGSYLYNRISTDCQATPGCHDESYSGPSTINITGTVTATDFISPAHIYVVDALPLTLAADSLTPAAVAWDATGLTLTARVSNTSDLAFSLAPSSTLSIPFAPRAGLAVAAAGDAAYTGVGMWSEPLSLPPHSALTLTFANTDTLAGKADGVYTPTLLLRGAFTDAVGTYDFHQHLDPAGNTVWVDGTPPAAGLDSLPAFISNTTFTVAWQGSDALSGLAGFDVQVCAGAGAQSLRGAGFAVARHEAKQSPTYGGGIASQTALAMTPQETAACPEWNDWLTGTAALSAAFTAADGMTYAFRARAIDRAGNVSAWTAPVTTTVDATAPVIALAALDAWSAGTFTVTWTGSDAPAGVASYEVQVSKDGGAWQAVESLHDSAPLTGFGPRNEHGWVYDSGRGRFVLFGGWDGSQYRNDTWEFDGQTWRQVVTPHAPSVRIGFGMAYDSGRGRVLLFGGSSSQWADYLGDTWEFDGADWTQIATAAAPAPRRSFGMEYDAGRGRTVLFGGIGEAGLFAPLGDTWEYDGAAWTQQTPAQSPSPRGNYGGLVYDSARGRLILHAGWMPNCWSQETWEYDGLDWVRRATSGPARYAHLVGYDPDQRRMILHGGGNCYAGTNDTWEYDPAAASWMQTVPIGADALYHGPLAYDPVSRRLLSYGGFDADTGGLLDELWAYDGRTHAWQRVGTVLEGVLSTDADGLSLVFLGRDGHSYAFRVRATDRAGNVSAWTTPVTTTVVTSAPPAAIIAPASGGGSGRDLLLVWPRDATVTAFQVWRSAAPYFTPGAGGSTLIGDQDAANCTVGTTTVTCTDAGALGGVGNYFYVVRVFNGMGLWSDSAGSGAFTFGITPGGP